MSFFSNIGEKVSQFFVDRNQKAYVSNQVDILNTQIENDQRQMKYIAIGGLIAIIAIGFLLLLQRR